VKERTLCIVKPDAVKRRVIGHILAMIEEGGLTPVATRLLTLAPTDAERFYAVHRERPFFADLVRFMSSGPVFVAVLEGDGAITRWRDLMGPTDSKKAPKKTVRGEFGTDIEKNAVHGSDGPDTARAEIGFFFSGFELPGATVG